MSVVLNEVYGGTTSQPKNIGKKEQRLEAPIKTYMLAKDGFSFASKDDFKDKTKWETAVQEKKAVPFPLVEGIEANNTEESVKNGRFKDYTLKDAVRGQSYRADLSICTYDAVKSYENSEYTRIFRITTENEVTCEVQDDGSIKGEPLAGPIRVGARNEATDEDVPFANVLMKFKEDLFSILKPGFDISDMEGIYDARIEIVSASATSIKFKVLENCTDEKITTLVQGDVELKDDSGQVQSPTFVAADPNGVYELTGTGFATGFTLDLSGIVTQGENSYESIGPVTITVV